MSTRAAIVYGKEEDSYGFYLHFDGGIGDAGEKLRKFYSSEEAAEALSRFAWRGGISYLPHPEESTTEEWFLSAHEDRPVLFDGAKFYSQPMFSGDLETIAGQAQQAACSYFYWWDVEHGINWQGAKLNSSTPGNLSELPAEEKSYIGIAEDIMSVAEQKT